MCPSVTGRGPRSIRAFAGGRRTARSTGCCGPPRRKRTRRATSTGWCPLTPRSCGPTSMRPGPEKGAARPGPRPVQRRPDQQDPPGLRRQGPAARFRRHGRQHQRLHPVHHRDGSDPSAPHRTRDDPAPGPIKSWETRATARRRSAPGSAAGASRTRFPSGPTRSAIGPGEAAAAAARRPSTARSTSTATSWKGASTA